MPAVSDRSFCLAPFAVSEAASRGRRLSEAAPYRRSEFARDRDRIIHSTAFRRLEYKTQVFVNHEGDLFRTRLTHSIEVAQIARSLARALAVNDELAEAVALAHDLGHTPFGHAGQDALDACMGEFGGFEHNLQSLRIVDQLEQRYAAFDGLNLMYETREGILKHCPKNAESTTDSALYELLQRFSNNLRPSLEAQICNLADEIAYNNHDIDDGLRSGLIQIDELMTTRLFAHHAHEVSREFSGLSERRLIHETVRRMIGAQVADLLAESERQIRAAGVTSPAEVRQAPALISFSPEMKAANAELKRFLMSHLYRHPRVVNMTEKAARIIHELFAGFMADPAHLPEQYHPANTRDQARIVADYIAGMTDRYAIREHARLQGISQADAWASWQ